MTTDQIKASSRGVPESPRASRVWTVVWSVVGAAIIGLIVATARRGAVSDRIRNPDVTGAPRPVKFLFGYQHWIDVWHIFTVILLVVLIVGFIVLWRKYPKHPYLLMALVTSIIIWQDPIMNWAPFAVYDPMLWHYPEDFPWAAISPTVEPFICFGYVAFQFGPFFAANWILRKLQAKRPTDAFVWRHPLISLAALILVVGFIIDAMLETTLVGTGLYIYSQVPPFGSVFAGKPWQFPLIWESSLVTLVMISAGVLVYRDDTGRTVAEKLALRAKILPSRPTLGTFLVMLAIVNLAYFAYGAGFWAIKATGIATSVACPWPYPDAKVYDPQGFYEKSGQPGPYFNGVWATWASGQPDGRPDVRPPADGGRCQSAHH
jgi:hypothetical protein